MENSRFRFRAWLEIKNEYGVQGMYIPTLGEYNDINDEIENLQAENVIFMQYIGLEDKNKKPICEGDIVSTATRRWVIEYRNDPEFCGFVPAEIGVKDNHLSVFIRYDAVEVIGNIYEDKHLLKAT